MTLSFSGKVAARDFDVTFEVATGETVAILGPNGAGKSTLLGLIAGLVKPDAGAATLDDTVLFSRSRGSRATSSSNSFAPPHTRGVTLLAQDPLLFPHLTVLENVAFGPRSAGIAAREARTRARRWLEEVDAAEFADRTPARLSGGQAQRIAVARALAADPKLLLLDEPMAALDIAVAPTLRRMLKRVLADRTAIIVTHDLLDALILADRVIVIEGGRVVEQGATRSVLEHPRTAFTAGLAGLNLFVGTRTDRGLLTDEGYEIGAREAEATALGVSAAAVVAPASVTLSINQPTDAALTTLSGPILDLEPRGDQVRVRSQLIAADVSAAVIADLDLSSGDTAWFSFTADDAAMYPLS